MAFVEAVETPDELAQVPKRVHGPCLLNIVPGGKTPPVTLAEAQALGYRLAILPGLLLGATLSACDRALRELRDGGAPASAAPGKTVADTFRRFGADEWNALRQPVLGVVARTLCEKLWDAHVVRELGSGWDLLHVDRHLLHDLSGPPALGEIHRRKLEVRNPELTFAVSDHAISSAPGRNTAPGELGLRLHGALKSRARVERHPLLRPGRARAGHRARDGPRARPRPAGADTDLWRQPHLHERRARRAGLRHRHVRERARARHADAAPAPPKQMRVHFDGALGPGVTAKDLILHTIAALGAAAGAGYAIEYAGPAIRALPIEGRLTLCNLAVELGAKVGLVAPDDARSTTCAGRPFAPQGADFDAACARWRELSSDDGRAFDRDERIDAARSRR